MGEVLDSDMLEWQAVRPDVSRGVDGKTLLAGDVKVVLTRVAPGGKVASHKDDYAHLLYFLRGEGLVWAGENRASARAGLTVRVPPGEPHGYENTGTEDLMLIAMNVPAPERPPGSSGAGRTSR